MRVCGAYLWCTLCVLSMRDVRSATQHVRGLGVGHSKRSHGEQGMVQIQPHGTPHILIQKMNKILNSINFEYELSF